MRWLCGIGTLLLPSVATTMAATVFQFNPRNADDIFVEFFSGSSRWYGWGGMPSMRAGGTRFCSSIFWDDIFGSTFGNGGLDVHDLHTDRRVMKAPTIEWKLSFNLEELYKGITKKISREIADEQWVSACMLFSSRS
ncbi:hypothetical protein ZEAMMB73_Zm00001d041946 [Zea mays]|uniref:Uncharacterized protein n=1 Tax=Zea mays TaxID=4577 RepID=A0A1D6MZY7_MAIZE|nr:hypothetical protein ZEAMMB73_Zm00001d041946 [Zea mays]